MEYEVIVKKDIVGWYFQIADEEGKLLRLPKSYNRVFTGTHYAYNTKCYNQSFISTEWTTRRIATKWIRQKIKAKKLKQENENKGNSFKIVSDVELDLPTAGSPLSNPPRPRKNMKK